MRTPFGYWQIEVRKPPGMEVELTAYADCERQPGP